MSSTNTFDTKAGQLRQAVDTAQDAVTQAEALVKQTKDRLVQAREEYLEHILKDPAIGQPAGFSTPVGPTA